jgi:hypothetical protein
VRALKEKCVSVKRECILKEWGFGDYGIYVIKKRVGPLSATFLSCGHLLNAINEA